MGGGHHFPYPKWVWSPSGGWWPSPVHWKRNTAIYGVFMIGVSFLVYSNAAPKTVSLIIF
jgi:hypothetical protein